MAELTNHGVQEFGNNPVRIDAGRVRALRAGGAASPLLALARVGMACAAVLLLVLALLWMRRRRRIARAS